MPLKLLGNRLIVSPVITTQVGAIHIPQSAQEPGTGSTRLFVVRLVGEKVKEEISVGDQVLTQSFTEGQLLAAGDEQIINADQVIAVIPK